MEEATGTSIHDRIRLLRKTLGLSQKDFGDGLGFSRAYMGA